MQRFQPYWRIAAGLGLGLVSLVSYVNSGYSKTMLWLWLAALVVLAVAFWQRSRTLPQIALADVGIGAGLVAVAAPLYLLVLERWPVQVSSDEIAVMQVSNEYAHATNVDPFGVSWYLSRPAGLFIVWGKMGELIGGIDLFHMRLLHAVVGLLTIAVSYVLFRQLLPRGWAAVATIVLATNHAMFMISRFSMRENTALLAVTLTLTLLLWGLRNQNELATFLGGVVAGLACYAYEPGRVAFPIWIVFLIGVGLLYRRRFPARTLLRLGAIAAVGAVLTATPIAYANSQVPSFERNGQRDSLFFFNDARNEQQRWVFAKNQWDAYKKNVEFGLGTFNNGVVDHSWIYENRGHGFVDPLTGILLWLGVGVVGVPLVRRKREDEGALLMLGGFLFLWLSFAFVVNKAPNYTRLLVILPFVAYLVTEAVRWLAGRWRSIPRVPAVIAAGFLAAIVVWNLTMAWDFVDKGRREGDPIGSTGRSVQAREDRPRQLFYFVDSPGAPYYVWGDLGASMSRVRFFMKDPTQVAAIIDPTALASFNAPAPFSLYMRREAWQAAQAELADRYPRGRITNVTPDGARVVLDVPN